MSKDNSSSHFTVANVQLLADNLPCVNQLDSIIVPIKGDKYEFEIYNRNKAKNIVLPFYDTCSDSFFDYFDYRTNLSLKNKVLKNDYISEVNNVFVILHYLSDTTGIKIKPDAIKLNQKEGHSVLVRKKDYVNNSTWQLETAIQTLHQSCSKMEKNERIDEKLFDYKIDSMLLDSYYLFTDKSLNTVNIYIPDKSVSKIQNLWNLLTSQFDITKAQYNYIILSEAIDSVNVNLYFNDIVKFYPLSLSEESGIKYEKGSNYIKLHDIKSTHSNNHGTYRLFRMSKDDNKAYSAEGIYNNARYNKFSFFAQRVGTEKLQWIRIFFASTVLAYLVSILFMYMNKFLRVFKKNKTR
jgi:hypothetical protein